MRYFFNYTKPFFFIFIFGVELFVTGCGPQSVPVSSNQSISKKIDSIFVSRKTTKDSSFYKETVTRKTLPAASVEILTTKKQLDSLIAALGTLPKSVTRSFYYQDPKMHATLSVILDSIGRVHFMCTAEAQMYFEKNVQQARLIDNFSEVNSKLLKENSALKIETLELKKGFLEKLKDSCDHWAVKLWILMLLVAFAIMLYKYVKTLNFGTLLTGVFKLFKRRN